MEEYVIYQGKEFTVEWFYDEKGSSKSLEYFEELTTSQKQKFLFLVKKIGDFGKINNKEQFRNEGDKIYAFKPQPDRFLCFFFEGNKIVVTNAFKKKQNKLPKNQKEKALKFMSNYKKRIKEENYYE